jgi:hypothetical protein
VNPPSLILFNDFGGDWAAYEEALDKIFRSEIAYSLTFRGDKVNCRRTPEEGGRWAAFWHLVSEGKIEDDRTPDLRRCERLAWVPWVISNWNQSEDIEWWENTRGSEVSVLLWYQEAYLVILAKRNGYWLLKSAYVTNQSHRVATLAAERNRFHGPRKS